MYSRISFAASAVLKLLDSCLSLLAECNSTGGKHSLVKLGRCLCSGMSLVDGCVCVLQGASRSSRSISSLNFFMGAASAGVFSVRLQWVCLP